MRSTFKLEGPAATKGEQSAGTAFILAQPDSAKPQVSHFVLITAAHVFEKISGEQATLNLRTAKGDGFKKLAHKITIRSKDQPLWVRHPDVDVAALHVALPTNADLKLASTLLLGTDELLERYNIGPGDESMVLGYPHGASANAAGFPILRSGRIASYPLTPTAQTKTFLLDFQVFPGNSGGPVFIYAPSRFYDEKKNPMTVHFILGLVTREMDQTERIKTLDGEITRKHSLGIGIVAHAQFIREVLDRLPPPEPAAKPATSKPLVP